MPEQKDNENLYQEIVTNMLEGVMVFSMKGKITMLNPAAERMLGLTQDDIGSSFGKLFLVREGIDAFNTAILDAIYEKGRARNTAVDYELNGEIRNLTLTTSYIHSQGAKFVIVVISDVTELNELRDARVAMEKIEQAKNEAILANNAKSIFLSNMAHEIRTPLNAVLGMDEMILRECADQQILSYAANIQSSGRTLLSLINDLLDMSKIESGKLEIIPVEYKIANLMLDLWNVIYFRAQDKNLSVSFLIDETLPGTLYGDDVRVKQIITNLLTNAVKYTPEGSVALRAAYEKPDADKIALVVSVEDTGMGIKEEDMGKLFESFQRLEEDKNRNIEGTGLGMSITTSLLKMMDGDMKVESEYRKGSVFTVTIPQKVVDWKPAGDFETIRSTQGQTGMGSRQVFEAPQANVLVVDDNAMNLTIFTALLKRTRMNIVTASSGKDALQLVKEQPFHIIFMDHMMPEMDGVETLHEIQKLTDFPNEKTPVIALTANAISGVREFYIQEGFADFFTKPIDGMLLEQMIASYLPKELVQMKEMEEQAPGEADGEEYDDYLNYGISITQGLSHSVNRDMYVELVGMFLKDSGEQEEKLRQFIFKEEMKEYGILIHAVKGNARSLGAEKLADIAFEHERESKAGNLDYVKAHWKELEDIWRRTKEGFDLFYQKHCKNQPDKYAAVSSGDGEILELSQEELMQAAGWIDKFETQKAITQLKEWLKSPLKPEIYERIRSALAAIEDEYDDDKAMKILNG